MKVPVIWPKIIIPKRRTSLLSRQRLIDNLHELLDYKLLVVSAPAGYGKTTLLVDFASQTELPVCWYSLDEHDQDVQRFLAHLIASITHRFPSFGKNSANALQELNDDIPDPSQLVSIFINDIFENISEPFAVVLDDFHIIEINKQIINLLNLLVQRSDENFHLIISTRKLLVLPDLSLMVARQLAGGLGYEKLAFQMQEARDLLLQNYGLTISDVVAARLCQETEGWITGLLLSAETIGQALIERVQMVRSMGVDLYDYLTKQVFDKLPAHIQQLLLRTSLFDEFDTELCQKVLEPIFYPEKENWPRLIDALIFNNLFVQLTEGDRVSLRYHHLFRDFLQKKFAQEYPGDEALILEQLAAVYSENQDWDKAFAIYKRIGDPSATANFIGRIGLAMVNNGRYTALARWLGELPGDIFSSRPLLLALSGVTSITLGKIEDGLKPLNKAIVAFQHRNDLEHLARTLAWRASAYRFLGKYTEALDDANEILGLFQDSTGQSFRAEALRVKGLVLQQLGKLDEALTCLEQAMKDYQALGDEKNAATVGMGIGVLLRARGEYGRSRDAYLQALEIWRKTNNIIMSANLLNNLGVLLHYQGDYQKAIGYLEEALDLAKQSGDGRVEALALSGVGDIYLDFGDVSAAQNSYSKAYEIASRIHYRFLLLYLELAQCAAARTGGNLVEARNYLAWAEARIFESHSNYEKSLHQYELGQILFTEGSYLKAVQNYTLAIHLLTDSQHIVEVIRAKMSLALVYYALNESDRALDEMKQALRASQNMESLSPLMAVAKASHALLVMAQSDPEIGHQASRLLDQIEQTAAQIVWLRRHLRTKALTMSFTGPKLVIKALGKMEVLLYQKRLIDWQAQVARDMLFCILAHPQGLTKEEIGELLWPECSLSQLRIRFKKSIYRLRRVAGDDVILFQQDRYFFNQGLDYEYDVETFSRMIDQAQEEGDPGKKAVILQRAIGLYNGPYLSELDNTWIWPERERLWRAFVNATLSLAAHYLEHNETDLALEFCNRIISEDPLREDAHRIAMRVHAATGNRAGVNRQYEVCQQVLEEELGVPPSPQTTALYKTLAQ